jgi:hypothetical protein
LHHYSNHEVQDVSTGEIHQETIQHKQEFIKYDVSPFGIDETVLQPLVFHDNIVVLDVVKGFFAQEIYQQLQDFLLPLFVMKHMMFMACFKEVKRIMVLLMQQNLHGSSLVFYISWKCIMIFKIQ